MYSLTYRMVETEAGKSILKYQLIRSLLDFAREEKNAPPNAPIKGPTTRDAINRAIVPQTIKTIDHPSASPLPPDAGRKMKQHATRMMAVMTMVTGPSMSPQSAPTHRLTRQWHAAYTSSNNHEPEAYPRADR
ncbi:hypothetical protein ccbrp13_37680 [Ktedonobacteria bacterium brp13]|nr:hypothetical protein ccbrp13_37680 [Ktedonobacteria bacterium brp13]